MYKIDLTSKAWCDIIFKGKNQGYGAYEMRQSSPKRHNYAFLITVLLTVCAFFLPMVIRFVLPKKEKLVVTEVTTLSDLSQPQEKKVEQPKVFETPPPPLKSSIKFTPPVIKKDAEVKDADEMKTQAELNESKVAISIADVKGTDEESGKDIAEIQEVTKQVEETKPYQVVEQMPTFPGGDQKLMEFLSSHVRYPVIAQENGIQGRVIVRFVVSKTGEVSNVEVIRSLDSSCDAEAIRLIKSMPKWIPGRQNGVNVPVYFTMPIVFKLN